jgi:hypothetical protein
VPSHPITRAHYHKLRPYLIGYRQTSRTAVKWGAQALIFTPLALYVDNLLLLPMRLYALVCLGIALVALLRLGYYYYRLPTPHLFLCPSCVEQNDIFDDWACGVRR